MISCNIKSIKYKYLQLISHFQNKYLGNHIQSISKSIMSIQITEPIRQTQLNDIIQTLQNKIASLTRINQGQKRTNQRTQALKQQFKSQRDLADQRSQKMAQQNIELKERMASIDKENRQLKQKIQDFQLTKLQSSTSSNSEVEAQIAHFRFQVEGLRLENAQLKERIRISIYENQKFTAIIDSLKKDLDKVKQELQSYKGEKTKSILVHKFQQPTSQKLNQQIDFDESNILKQSKLVSRKQEQSIQVTLYETQKSQINIQTHSADQQTIEKLTKIKQDTQRTLKQRQNTIKEQNIKIQAFQADLTQKQINIERLRINVQDSQRKLEEKQRDFQRIQSINQQLQKSIENYKIQLANKCEDSVERIEGPNENLLKQLDYYKRQLKDKELQIQSVKSVLEQKLQHLSQQLNEAIMEAEHQRKKLAVQTQKMQKANKEIQQLKKGQFIAFDQTQELLYSFHKKVIQINDYLRKLQLDPKQFEIASKNRSLLRQVMKSIVDQQICQ